MNERLENIDDLFKDNQDGFEKQPSPMAWSRLETLLDQVAESEVTEPKTEKPIDKAQRKPKKFYWSKWLSIAAMFLLVSLPAMWFLNNGNPQASKTMAVAEKTANEDLSFNRKKTAPQASSGKVAKEQREDKLFTQIPNNQQEYEPIIAEAELEEKDFNQNLIRSTKKASQMENSEIIAKEAIATSDNNQKASYQSKEPLIGNNEEKLVAEKKGNETMSGYDGNSANKEVAATSTTGPAGAAGAIGGNKAANGYSNPYANYESDDGINTEMAKDETTPYNTEEASEYEVLTEESEEVYETKKETEEEVVDIGTIKMERTRQDSKDASTDLNLDNMSPTYETFGQMNSMPAFRNYKYDYLIGTWTDKQDKIKLEVYRIDIQTLQFNFIEDEKLKGTITLTENVDGISLKEFSTSSNRFYTYNESEYLSKGKESRFDSADGRSIVIISANKNKIKWRSTADYGEEEIIFFKK